MSGALERYEIEKFIEKIENFDGSFYMLELNRDLYWIIEQKNIPLGGDNFHDPKDGCDAIYRPASHYPDYGNDVGDAMRLVPDGGYGAAQFGMEMNRAFVIINQERKYKKYNKITPRSFKAEHKISAAALAMAALKARIFLSTTPHSEGETK